MAENKLALARRRLKRDRMRRLAASVWLLMISEEDRRPRSVWTRDWLMRREQLGAFDTLLTELRAEDQASFLNFLRVSPGIFDSLLDKVTPLIKKEDTTYRKAISPDLRLAITLCYLATGKQFTKIRSKKICSQF